MDNTSSSELGAPLRGSSTRTEKCELLCTFVNDTELCLVNMFTKSVSTWTSSYGTSHNVDYIGTSLPPTNTSSSVYVADRIDLSIGLREDHKVVGGDFVGVVAVGAEIQKQTQRFSAPQTAC